MPILRTRFKRDIVAEFLPPARKQDHRKGKVMIICCGVPSVPSKASLLKFFAHKGYWVFFPRYRGTWESGGKFLRKSLEKDVLDVISSLPRGFRDLYSGKAYRLRPARIYILGSSFGGPAAILASRDKRVSKAVLISSVVDWTLQNKRVPRTEKAAFLKLAFGEGYRFSLADWKKLAKGNFYNPMRHIKDIDGKKLFFIHAKNDPIVRFVPVARFAKTVGAQIFSFSRGGHIGTTAVMKPHIWKRAKRFLR